LSSFPLVADWIKEKGDNMKYTSSYSEVIRKVVQTALFIALALVLRNFSTMIYMLGAPGMRINFAPIFSRMPSLLFGPFYGGISAAIVDIIGYLLKPEGAYIPLMTLIAILGGVMTGYLWTWLKKGDAGKIQRGLWIIFIAIGAVGLFNYINTVFFPQSYVTKAIEGIGKNKDFAVLGLVAISAVGIVLLIINFAIQKKFPDAAINKYYIKVLVAFGLANITVTVLNTWALQVFIPELGKIGFILFLIPRLIKEVFMIVIQSYIVAFLLSVYDRFIKDRSQKAEE
jgi:ECF transporter S component (folate family)